MFHTFLKFRIRLEKTQTELQTAENETFSDIREQEFYALFLRRNTFLHFHHLFQEYTPVYIIYFSIFSEIINRQVFLTFIGWRMSKILNC